MKRLQLVLAAVLALLASFIVAAPASHAADVTFVQGITNGKFGEYQAFDVSRVPSNPLCTNSVPDEFKVTVKDPASPNTGASGGAVKIGGGYLQVFESGDADFPWGLNLYNAAGEELRYDSTTSTWVTKPAAGWGSEKHFAAGGNLVAASENGVLHISKETGASWGGGYGTYLSITTPYIAGDKITYTPSKDLNTCTTYKTSKATNTGGTDTQNGPVLNPDSAKTMYFPDNPLGPPNSDATLRKLVVNTGEVEGQVKPDVKDYNWGLGAAAGASTGNYIRIFPLNAASEITVDGYLYRSGQAISVPVLPSTSTTATLKFSIKSVDGTATNIYTITMKSYNGSMPTVTKIEPNQAQNTGGQKMVITGSGFKFAKGVYFTPNEDVYDGRSVYASAATKTFKVISDKKIEVYAPAVPKADGSGNWTGLYNVIVDTPYANSALATAVPGAVSTTQMLYKNPTVTLKPIDFAKKVVYNVLTKLVGKPIKVTSKSPVLVKIFVKFLGRSKPVGDVGLYTIVEKSDGWYIKMNTKKKAAITAVVTAKATDEYAPFYKEKVWTTK